MLLVGAGVAGKEVDGAGEGAAEVEGGPAEVDGGPAEVDEGGAEVDGGAEAGGDVCEGTGVGASVGTDPVTKLLLTNVAALPSKTVPEKMIPGTKVSDSSLLLPTKLTFQEIGRLRSKRKELPEPHDKGLDACRNCRAGSGAGERELTVKEYESLEEKVAARAGRSGTSPGSKHWYGTRSTKSTCTCKSAPATQALVASVAQYAHEEGWPPPTQLPSGSCKAFQRR